jgi:CRP-like cAMP-binding protein
MPESEELYAQVDALTREVQEHGVILRSLLRTQARELRDAITAEMDVDPLLARILLLVDGVRTQGEIVEELNRSQHGATSQPTVSRKMSHLRDDLGLIAPIRRTKQGQVYKRTVLDEALGVSRALERR